MDTDRFLTRLIAGAVCGLASVMVLTLCWQVIQGYEADKNLHDLTYILIGALVSQVTTHAVQQVKDGMQQVQVPAPLIPDTALTTPDVTANPDPPTVEVHEDAPASSDL